MEQIKLGSLFSGSGGFELGAILAGIRPVWNSEIEPFPIRVTTRRLPSVKHYGDVSAVNGAQIEPVDIITFGSPCQDMSIAGKREGLEGSRSSLFYEAIRIVKEMREATDGRYPKYIVWENVTGAFSSNKGEDFRTVLEEICRIKDPAVSVAGCVRWQPAGCILGNGYSVAWRVLDAQYWGVPQRRKRIYLVADLAGQRAGKVLFESEGVSGYTPQGFRSWQGSAGAAEEGAHPAGIGTDGYNGAIDTVATTLGVNCGMSTGRNGVMVLNDQGGQFMDVSEDVTGILRSQMSGHPPAVLESPDAIAVENHPTDSRVTVSADGKVQTLTSRMGTGGNNVPLVMKIRCGCEGGGKGPLIQTDKSATLATNNDQTVFVPTVYGICAKDSNAMKSDNPNSGFYKAETEEDVANTLVATDYKDPPTISEEPYYIVRRLTPTECARLQGFPDWWCSNLETPEPTEEEIRFWSDVFETHRKALGKKTKPKTRNQIIKWLKNPHTDSAEYKMWGNGVALPCVYFVLAGIACFFEKKMQK